MNVCLNLFDCEVKKKVIRCNKRILEYLFREKVEKICLKMIENIIICANFAFFMYVCGKTYISGCNTQQVEKESVSVDCFGKFLI